MPPPSPPPPPLPRHVPLAGRPIAGWFGLLGVVSALLAWVLSAFFLLVGLGETLDPVAREAGRVSRQRTLAAAAAAALFLVIVALVLGGQGRKKSPLTSLLALALGGGWVALVAYGYFSRLL